MLIDALNRKSHRVSEVHQSETVTVISVEAVDALFRNASVVRSMPVFWRRLQTENAVTAVIGGIQTIRR